MKKAILIILLCLSHQAFAGKRTTLIKLQSKNGLCEYKFDVHYGYRKDNLFKQLIGKTSCESKRVFSSAECIAEIPVVMNVDSNTQYQFDCNLLSFYSKPQWYTEKELREVLYNKAMNDLMIRMR